MNSRRWFLSLAVFALLLSAAPAVAIDLGECNSVCTPSCPCRLTCEISPGNTVTCGDIRDWFGWPCVGYSSSEVPLELAENSEVPQLLAAPVTQEPALDPAEPQLTPAEVETPAAK